MIFDSLIQELEKIADPERSEKMSAYMKNRFDYFGIPSPERRNAMRNWKQEYQYKADRSSLKDLIELYNYPKRECAYVAIDWMIPWFKKYSDPAHFQTITELITTNSWWDSVDLIASNILGPLMQKYPELIPSMVEEYHASGNMWLQRSTLIFQLKYKENTDSKLLYSQCLRYRNSKEFFIQKAIGWALREYAKVNPKSVYEFVDSHELPKLSIREATKHRKS